MRSTVEEEGRDVERGLATSVRTPVDPDITIGS
jgi:hypothetical protein